MPGKIRTLDLSVRSGTLYQLSYGHVGVKGFEPLSLPYQKRVPYHLATLQKTSNL